MTHSRTQPGSAIMTSYADLPEVVRDHLASLEIFIGDMDDLELRNGDVIDSSFVVPAFNGIVAALRVAARPAGMRVNMSGTDLLPMDEVHAISAELAQPAGVREAIAKLVADWHLTIPEEHAILRANTKAICAPIADAILALPAERPADAQAAGGISEADVIIVTARLRGMKALKEDYGQLQQERVRNALEASSLSSTNPENGK